MNIPRKLKQIHLDGINLCGARSDGSVFCANANLTTSPNWQELDGFMVFVTVARGGQLVGIDANSNVWIGTFKPPCTSDTDCLAGETCSNTGESGSCESPVEVSVPLSNQTTVTQNTTQVNQTMVSQNKTLEMLMNQPESNHQISFFSTGIACRSNDDCLFDLVCLNPGENGVCGNAHPDNEMMLVPDEELEGEASRLRRRMTLAHGARLSSWMGLDIPNKVVLTRMLVPLAEDAYNDPPSQSLGFSDEWEPATEAISGDSSQKRFFKSWDWLKMTVY